MHLILTAADVRQEADDRLVLLPKALSECDRQQKAQIVNVNVIYVLSCVYVVLRVCIKIPSSCPPPLLLLLLPAVCWSGVSLPSVVWRAERGLSCAADWNYTYGHLT